MNGIVERYNRPFLFYFLATAIPWTCWLIAARLSHLGATGEMTRAESLIALMGLLGPMLVAGAMILSNGILRTDLGTRLLNFRNGHPAYWLVTALLMPASILLAMAISVFLGYSPAQFQLASHASFTAGIFPVWFVLIGAPVIEELGWHTYGTDCLVSRFTLFTACLLFAVFWGVWHAPLTLIRDYYQSNVVLSGLLYTLNFPLSIVPFVIIMNWLYYRTGRNIWVAVLFHVTAGYFNELFTVHPMSKVIQTGLLLAFAAFVLLAERRLFFGKAFTSERRAAAA